MNMNSSTNFNILPVNRVNVRASSTLKIIPDALVVTLKGSQEAGEECCYWFQTPEILYEKNDTWEKRNIWPQMLQKLTGKNQSKHGTFFRGMVRRNPTWPTTNSLRVIMTWMTSRWLLSLVLNWGEYSWCQFLCCSSFDYVDIFRTQWHNRKEIMVFTKYLRFRSSFKNL